MVFNNPNIKTGDYARRHLFSKFWPTTFSHRARFKFALSLINKYNPQTVVDYGCGDGTFLLLIHDRVERGIGVEINYSDVEALKKSLTGLNNIQFFTVEEFRQLKELRADLVFCMEVLEHATDISGVIEMLKKCTSEKGCVIISVPNEIGFILIIKTILRRIGALFNVGFYKYHGRYYFKDFFSMLFANEDSRINRPMRAGTNEYTHVGFNWKYFKKRYLDDNFSVCSIEGSPFGFAGTCFSSQIWFTLKKR